MKSQEFKTLEQNALMKISAALFDLRDALTDLSLTLRDYQFKTDLDRRQKAEEMVQQLLQDMKSTPGSCP